MATIKEDYCSKEIYRLLREKGFDGEIHTIFDGEGYTQPSITPQMAMKWLRKVHNLHVDSSIYIGTDGDSEHEYTYTYWDWTIFNSESGGIIAEPQIGCGRYDSYEQACEKAIKYCLENLI